MRALALVPGRLAVCRLPPGTAPPAWATRGAWWSVTRTPDELSVVCPEEDVPADVAAARGYRALTVAGPLDLALTGVAAALTAALAAAGVPVLVVATHDTDHLLVEEGRLGDAVPALAAVGYELPTGVVPNMSVRRATS